MIQTLQSRECYNKQNKYSTNIPHIYNKFDKKNTQETTSCWVVWEGSAKHFTAGHKDLWQQEENRGKNSTRQQV